MEKNQLDENETDASPQKQVSQSRVHLNQRYRNTDVEANKEFQDYKISSQSKRRVSSRFKLERLERPSPLQ